MLEMKAMLLPSGDHVGRPTWRVMYSFSTVRLRGSTCALGLEAICLGSVTDCGAGKVWAVAVSVTTVLMSMTIAKSTRVRMKPEPQFELNRSRVIQSSSLALLARVSMLMNKAEMAQQTARCEQFVE